MKLRKETIIGLALLAGVAACKEEKKTPDVTAPKIEAVNPGDLKIAFYNSDSLAENYTFLKEQDSLMKLKETRYNNALLSRQRSLESLAKTIEEARQKMTATPEQFAKMEQNFYAKQQDAAMYQQNEGMKLQKEVADIQKVIANKMLEASKSYCEKFKIDILLVHGQGGQFGYIKPSMDVTKSFTEFVNAEHDKVKEAMGE